MCDESQQRIAFDTDECASTAVHAHAKQELSEKFNASLLELHETQGSGPLFSVRVRRPATRCGGSLVTTPAKRLTPDPKSSLGWGQPFARDISTTVHQHDSRLECGDGDTHMLASARALAWRRAVGRIASFVPRVEDEHWLRWARSAYGFFMYCTVAGPC
jgi:hypothetical protein